MLLFFKGASVSESLYSDVATIVRTDRDSITKWEITRRILERVNENSERHLRERREILKRITEFEAFSTCWENDQLKAKGLVAEIQKVVNVKDSFTRMSQERAKESAKRQEEYSSKIAEIQKRKEQLQALRTNLSALFCEQNPNKRGKDLEKVLNGFFREYGILVREDFKRAGDSGDGIIEQIDGIIEVDNTIYLVEMKWKKDSIGSGDIYAHLGRIYHRANAHGIFISASGYAPSALIAAKEALVKNALLVLFDLEEFVKIIEQEGDFLKYYRDRVQFSIIDKDPYKKPS